MDASQALQTGDRVIDLTSVARNAGLAAGALTGLLVTWIVTGEPGRTLVFAAGGAIAGGIAGRLLGRIRYVKGGRRQVVKLGPAALQTLVTAGLSASVPVAILVWLGCLTVLGGPAPSLLTGAACLFSGVCSGIVVGRAASWL
jgi:hypothetical protein